MNRKRILALTSACTLALSAPAITALGQTDCPDNDRPVENVIDLQLLSFNDYHGHLEKERGGQGGAEYLAATLSELREGKEHSLTVAAGDLIGGSTFLSGMFHDEPAVETLNAMGLDISSVGNHEFDEGTNELQRMIDGGCHPTDGCYFDETYAGTDFQYLAANVVKKDTNEPFIDGVTVRDIDGIKVGFIGMTLEETPTLVNPAGVATVDFKDEIDTANRYADELSADGVNAIIVLLHEGGLQEGNYDACLGMSGPIVDIAHGISEKVDALITGHTHRTYTCQLLDPRGRPRLVASAGQYGRYVTDTNLRLDRRTGDVIRQTSTAHNIPVTQDVADPTQTEILSKWKKLADPMAARVVGTIAEDVTGDSGGNRGGETPMVDLIADSILFGTKAPEDGGAQIAFMNVGGVRSDFAAADITNGEKPGEITYAEAYAVAPFGNILVTMDLTGEQIERLLGQQYLEDRGRKQLALGVSEGFTYTWDDETKKVVPGSMTLNGEAIEADKIYRVATLNFLAGGGDAFTVFEEGTNILGGPEDLANLVDYLEANPGITPPADRVEGL